MPDPRPESMTSVSCSSYTLRCTVSWDPSTWGTSRLGCTSEAGGPQAMEISSGDIRPAAVCARTTVAASTIVPAARNAIFRMSGSLWLGLGLGLEVADPPLRFLEELAALVLLHELFEVGERFGFLFDFDECVREIEVDGVAAAVFGIGLQQILEARDRADVPALLVIEVADEIVGLVEPIPGVAQLRPHFRHQAAVRIAFDEKIGR